MEYIVAINAGSSTVKFAIFDITNARGGHALGIPMVAKARIEFLENRNVLVQNDQKTEYSKDSDVTDIIKEWLKTWYNEVIAIGHRVVHGADQYKERRAFKIDETTISNIDQYTALAPLHQPHALRYIRYMKEIFPNTLQFACFDTSFHSTVPTTIKKFGLPQKYANEKILRYGFHGLVYENVLSQIEKKGITKDKRIIAVHLGNGCSVCAIHQGNSYDTSMGFTAMEGLMMGTRCGRIDPGVILHLIESNKMTAKDVETILYKESGLKGVSGITNDMRALIESDIETAKEAVQLFCHMAIKEIFGLIGVLGGIDVITFSGGIGENAPLIRKNICEKLELFGLKLDIDANHRNLGTIHQDGSRVSAFVINVNEEETIAMHIIEELKSSKTNKT